MNEENKKAVAELYFGGLNPEDIADELGLDELQVIDYCAELIDSELFHKRNVVMNENS